MSLEETKKPKWDGRSRVSNNVFKYNAKEDVKKLYEKK